MPSTTSLIKQMPGCAILLKTVQLIMAVTIFCSLNAAVNSAEAADLNVLVIGSDHDPKNLFTENPYSNAAPFLPGGITNELQQIVAGAGLGSVNVQFEQYFAENATPSAKASNLASWFHWPYPADVETTTRWPNLRGENGTEWDYIILIGDPHTIEYTPGMYAQGVAKIAAEVAKSSNPAEVILLMPWPGVGSSSSVAHYKEVVYRVGRSGGLKVAPAALAWEAAGSPTGDTHPSTNGAYIAAASVYTRIWGKSAAESSYNLLPEVAAIVETTVTANIGVQQYTGKFSFQNPYLMLGDKRRSIFFEHRGSSTESGVQSACESTIAKSKIGFGAGAEPYAWNHGRQGTHGKSYRIDASQWQLGFGYWFRWNTWGKPIPTANDNHIGQIYDEYKFANYMRGQGSTARIVPWRLLWAQLHQVYPDLNPILDNAGHLSYGHGHAMPRYMYTIYSGRCPLEVKPSPMTANWQAQKIGYETAWRVGRCQMRAPGFKVMPSSVNAHTVTPTTAETMSVQFILPPEKPVTVQVSVSNAAANVHPKYLTFTPSNYDTAQFVHVQGLPGASASEPFNVQFDTVSEDLVYHELNDSWSYSTERSSVETVTVIDQAARSLTIPNRNATIIPLNVSGSAPSNTTFFHSLHGSISWFGENVIYTPAVDFIGTESFSFAVNQSGTLTRGHVTITVEDVPQLLFSESGLNKDTIVTEGGTTDSYTVALSQAPASGETVTVSLVPDSQMTVSATSLLFTAENWNVPQTVTVSAVEDTDLEPCYFGVITHSLSSDDLNWNDVSNNLPVSVFDNDTSYLLTVVNGSGDGSYVPGTDVAITADSPAENYHFDKWISSDGKIISDLTASDNYSVPGYATTITATYALDTYHLSFDQQGGEGGATTATAIYGKAMPLATVPTRTGYLFRGYFSETFGEGTQYYTYQMQSANNWDVTENTVLYAHWSPFHPLIQEDFESPVVSGYGAGSSPDNGKWVRSPNDLHGIVNKDGNAFSAPDPNHQAYAFWKTGTMLTTTEGALGVLEAGATYRFSFDVVVDLDNDEPGYFGTHYSVELMAFDPFRDTSGQNTGTVLASRSGDAPRDRTFKTVSFEFTADPDSHATEIGKALGFRIHGDSSSASYDNVIIEMINPPHRLSYDDNGADSGAVPVSIIEEFHPGEVVTVLGNTGSLSKDSFTFAGWNTAANGTGTTYTSGDTFYITSDITLYAQWYNSDASIIHYSAGMGGSISGDTTQFILSGSNGTSVTAVPDNTTYTFDQWSDGSTNATRQELSVSSNVTLTASFVLRKATQWSDANWSPLHLPSTELWLDAADAATVVMSGGSATSWHDKSGYGRHAVPDPASQPTYSTDSFNGSPTLEFATADEMIAEIPSNTFSSGINVYMVLKKHAYAYGDKFPFLRLKDGKAAPFKGRWDTSGYFNNRYVGDGSAEVKTFRKGIFPGAGSPLLLSIGIDATTYTEMYNVVSGWSGAHLGTYADTASDVIIGRGITAYDISEVVVTGSLEPEDRLKMEGYLAWKWLMEDNLPEGHPFKDMPPQAPDPNTVSFASAPAADSDTAISMTATTRSDPSLSVMYSFSETSGNSGGTSSGWQVSATYTDVGLTLDTTYSYTVTMRDSLGNIGPPSAVAMALTTGAPDTTAPTLISFGDDVGGGPITVGDPVTYPVTYTVTFSEAMNASTVDTADFENNPSLNGPATITVDSVGTTGNPAVFEVAVTTTGVGLLQLQIVSTATLEDPAANALVPASASPDNDIIAFANLVGELGILNLTANGGINPNTGNPWQVGDQYRLAFHTVGSTGTRNATSNDPADYNTYVTAEAHANATLVGTTWKAMVSVNLNSSTTEALSAKVNVKDNTDTADLSGGSGIGGAGFPVYAMDGTTCIARNNADIWNGWSNPFDSDSNVRTGSVRYSPFLDQFGNQTVNPNANDGIDVATGAKSNGSDSNPLGNTTDNTTFTRGSANANTSGRVWEIFTNNTSDTLSYYALSDPLTVQATSGGDLFSDYRVVDGSFENPTDIVGSWGKCPAVWNDTGSSLYEVGSEHLTAAADGNWSAYMGGVGTIYQEVGAVNAGDTLSVVFYGGRAKDGTNTDEGGVFNCTFKVGSSTNTVSADTTLLPKDSWQAYTNTWVATESGPLTLEFSNVSGKPWLDKISDVTVIAAADPYDAWATGGELSGDDANGDGVSNGLAFLLGAATPTVDAQGLLPVPTADGSGNLVMTFNCLPTTDRGTAALKVSYSKDLVSWTDTVNEVPDADGNDAGGDVSYVVVAGPAGTPTTITVTATIDSSVADGGGKLFGRLVGEE